MTEGRPMRADAVRNRRNILEAAELHMTTHGPDAGMDEIAREAGVAVGTLYRHFPTKADLLSAVIAQYVAGVADDAEQSLERVQRGGTAVAEVTGFLSRVTDSAAHNHAVKAAARGMGVDGHGDQSDEARAAVALASLIAIGQADGTIRAGISVDDIYILMATAPSDQPAEVRQRWLNLMLPGIIT